MIVRNKITGDTFNVSQERAAVLLRSGSHVPVAGKETERAVVRPADERAMIERRP
jgi:hypothetical protein